MPAVFTPNEIRVFDRSGAHIGSLTKFHIVQPRSHRINEVEDFMFEIPRADESGQILTNAVKTLLARDNLIFIANQISSMPGWGGAISEVTFADDKASVRVLGTASLLVDLYADLIEQNAGLVWQIAKRLVLAAQAKQAAHGDLVVKFANPTSVALGLGEVDKPNYGKFSYEGDVLAGLQQLAESSMSEFFMSSWLNTDGTFATELRWSRAGRWTVDHTSITLHDGVNGHMLPGGSILYTTADIANRIRLKGSPTTLESFIDYGCIAGIVKNVTPTIELVLDNVDVPNHRRRETLDLSVSYSYSDDVQRQMARDIQTKYLAYYKRFLYAYHNVRGRPFLDGYEWGGPDGTNDKKLTERYYRTYQKLGYIGQRTVIVGDSANNSVDAKIDDWTFERNISIVGNVTGIATNFQDPDRKFISSSTGTIYMLQPDNTNYSIWQAVAGTGETLKGIATDPSDTSTIWALFSAGGVGRIKTYDIVTKTLLAQFDISGGNLINDISVDSSQGELYCVANDGVGHLQIRDINNGIEITGPGGSFASGFVDPAGVSVTGGIAYIINSLGHVRMMFVSDGNFAANFLTGISANGIFTDTPDGEIWIVKANGDIAIFTASIAVSTVPDPGSALGAPGFEEIIAGQFVHIVATGNAAYGGRTNKLVIVYAPARYVTEVTETEIGTLNTIDRIWVTDDTRVGFSDKTKVKLASSQIVIQGEESRVCDWNPKVDGYGEHTKVFWRARGNRVVDGGNNWWFKEWDIPDSYFDTDVPDWPEGKAYLKDYLERNNKERTIQTVRIANVDNIWSYIRLGAKFTIHQTLQGGPSGESGVIRITSYEPDDLNGVMTIQGEWL